MDSLSVIIPSYNHWNLTHQRLTEIHRFCAVDEVVLIDDASEDPCLHILHFWKEKLPITYDRNYKNEGFGFSMNSGASRARGDILVFLSNDVVIHSDFTSEVRHMIAKHQRILVGHEIINFPAGWNEFEIDGKPVLVPYLAGHFLACHKDVWKELGGFDLRYGKYAFEDVDLSTNAILNGIDLAVLYNAELRHMVGQTAKYGPERDKITEDNKKIYLEKWINELRSW